MREHVPSLLGAILVLIVLSALMTALVLQGFPAFSYGGPAFSMTPAEADRGLIYLMWGDRFPDLIAQASLVVLTAAACISAVRLWRRRT